MRYTTFGLTALAALATGGVWAHSMSLNKVGYKETGGVHVASGTETATEDVILDRTASFFKTGLGTFSLSLAHLNVQEPFAMTVYGGTLKFTDGSDATIDAATAPTACQRAAFWVSPDSAVVTGGTYVARWCDVRESAETRDLDATPTRLYATPAWYNAGDNDGVPPIETEKHGRTAVYFGGHQAGKYMKWSQVVEPIQSVFLVHGCYDTFGAAIGYSVASRQGGFVPQFSSGSTKTYANLDFTLFTRADCSGDALSIQGFVDGVETDLSSVKPIQGFQLLECHYAPACTRADTFFFTRFEQLYGTDAKRQGGDYIAEALVFTNQLTETERLDIQRYLMKKWNLPRDRFADADTPNEMVLPQNVGTIGVAAGTTAQFDIADAASETTPFDFRGEGDLVKAGSGALVVGNDESGQTFNGSLTLSGGSVIARQGGRLPALKLEGGKRYTSAAAGATGSATVAVTEKAGLKLTASDLDDATKVILDGDGWTVANAIASGVKTICVTGGVLQLSAKRAATLASVDANACVTGFVANADFEQPFAVVDDNGWSAGMAGTTINGWTGSGFLRYMTAGGWAYGAYASGFKGQAPLEGTNILHLAGNGKFQTISARLPAKGVYELTCLMRSRRGDINGTNKDNYQQLEVGLCASTASTPVRFASVTVNDGPWQRIRLRLPESDAGQYRLCFTTLDSGGGDAGVNVDDIRLTLVPEKDVAVAFKIPNGDFEYGLGQASAPYRTASLNATNLLEGWSFGTATGTNPSAGFSGLSKFLSGPHFRVSLFNYYERPIGTGALTLLGSTGTASTSFTAPAGTYQLRAALSQQSVVVKVNGGTSDTELSATGVVKATLTLGDGMTVDLGTVSPDGRFMAEKLWPTSFTIPEAQTVTLTLSQSNAAATILDDLVFVTESADNSELVLDPSFEDLSHDYWKRDKTSVARVAYTASPISAYGYAVASGDYAARFTGYDAARYYQTITFAQAGLYRLRLKARSRADGGVWSCNPLEFTLAPTGDESSVVRIGKIDPMPLYRQFVGFEYLFRVETPGNYDFSIASVDHSATDASAANRQSFVDDVSITRVDEEVQSFELPEETRLAVSAGGQLHLDFTNQVTVSEVKLGGRRVYGVIDSSTHPEYVTGLGALVVPRKPGFILLVR